MRHLTTGILSEKFIIVQMCTYTNIDSKAY